jgi:hypothetical protein
MQEKAVIEINGVKLEVDLRQAKRIENVKVGSRVKLLTKNYSGYVVKHGVVIGFEPFEKLPTIIVAALELSYSEAKIEFVYFNAQSADTELVIAHDDDQAAVDKNEVMAKIDREIQKKEAEITELQNRKNYFLDKFQAYWTPVQAEEAEAA